MINPLNLVKLLCARGLLSLLALCLLSNSAVAEGTQLPVWFDGNALAGHGWTVSTDVADFPLANEGKSSALVFGLTHTRPEARIFVIGSVSSTPLDLGSVETVPPQVLLKHLRLKKDAGSGKRVTDLIEKYRLGAVEWRLVGPGDGVTFLPEARRGVTTVGLRVVLSFAAANANGEVRNIQLSAFLRCPSKNEDPMSREFRAVLQTLRPAAGWTLMNHAGLDNQLKKESDTSLFGEASRVVNSKLTVVASSERPTLTAEEREILERFLEIVPGDPGATLVLALDAGRPAQKFLSRQASAAYAEYKATVLEGGRKLTGAWLLSLAYGEARSGAGQAETVVEGDNLEALEVCRVVQRIEGKGGLSALLMRCAATTPESHRLAIGEVVYSRVPGLGWLPGSADAGDRMSGLGRKGTGDAFFMRTKDGGFWAIVGPPIMRLDPGLSLEQSAARVCSRNGAGTLAPWTEDFRSQLAGVLQEEQGLLLVMKSPEGGPVVVREDGLPIRGERDVNRKLLKRGKLRRHGKLAPLCEIVVSGEQAGD